MGASIGDMANAIRFLAMDGVQAANSGHPGAPMGLADAAAVLFIRHLKVDPSEPGWPDRDRFVLSAGHASMLQYALHHLYGFSDMTAEELRNFRQLGSITAGHPEYGHASGIETTTGPLGQGLATAVGLALAERMMNARYGDDLVDHRTWVFAGDGCLMEGISHEAIDLAGHLKLARLTVLWDDNGISIDGSTSLSTSTDQVARFRAAGWDVITVDGHDADALDAAFETAKSATAPTLIAAKTVIGKGAPNKAGSHKVHGAPLGAEEIAAAREAAGWSAEPFEIPGEILDAWRAAGRRSVREREAWQARLAAAGNRAAFEAAMDGRVAESVTDAMASYRKQLCADAPKVATRKSSEMALEVINAATDLTIGGSADLTGSNNTLTAGMGSIAAGSFDGRYIYYGVREHGMAAAMNGIALHGGFIPYGGTFLVFAGYAAGAIRLSALMGLRVIYVLTHDSIGLGEDGPTHQPVETLAMLRAIPNLTVLRPADAVEAAEAWEAALADRHGPTVLALSRQGLPALRTQDDGINHTARGGYVLSEPEGGRDITLIGTGSETHLAVEAAQTLAADGIRAAVVSLPSWELFEAQEAGYRAGVLGTAPRIAIEAAVEQGWSRYTGDGGAFVGMGGFGASAPAPALYKHFGITAAALAERARAILGRNDAQA